MRKMERDMLLRKIEEWRIKAQIETDPFNKYLSIFIAYNIFYNLYKKTEHPGADLTCGDSTRAVETRSLIDSEKLLEQLKSELIEYLGFIPIYREEFWNRHRRVPIFETLDSAFNVGNAEKTIEMLLKWLYKVRCNLIHGEKNYDDESQKKLLAQSSSLLEKILTHAVNSYCQQYVSGDKRNIFSP
ncbi:MAG: hypothetical protein OEY88_04245 [Candidatus Bathyarchaeota archaeon]|nr:hypothetical protein [Candidatus Bathyarchaeota archaeon]